MRIALKQTVGGKCIRFMKDGELGAIVHFPCQSDKTGLIVQRYQDRLITVGKSSGYSWPNFFDKPPPSLKDYLYRPLEPGDVIEVQND